MPLLPENEVAEMRRTVAHEGRTVRLRTWVLKLLEDRTELERRLREATPSRPISLGVVTGPEGR
jgi:hypothetical protein